MEYWFLTNICKNILKKLLMNNLSKRKKNSNLHEKENIANDNRWLQKVTLNVNYS